MDKKYKLIFTEALEDCSFLGGSSNIAEREDSFFKKYNFKSLVIKNGCSQYYFKYFDEVRCCKDCPFQEWYMKKRSKFPRSFCDEEYFYGEEDYIKNIKYKFGYLKL